MAIQQFLANWAPDSWSPGPNYLRPNFPGANKAPAQGSSHTIMTQSQVCWWDDREPSSSPAAVTEFLSSHRDAVPSISLHPVTLFSILDAISPVYSLPSFPYSLPSLLVTPPSLRSMKLSFSLSNSNSPPWIGPKNRLQVYTLQWVGKTGHEFFTGSQDGTVRWSPSKIFGSIFAYLQVVGHQELWKGHPRVVGCSR